MKLMIHTVDSIYLEIIFGRQSTYVYNKYYIRTQL